MVYQNGGPGSENPEGSDPPVPLVVSAAWPVRVGATPPLAERYTLRPESGHDVALALTRNPVVALTPRVYGADATPAHDLLRCTGKTQLAVQCAESQWQARAVDLLIWIDGSTRTSVLLGYADVATAITGSRPAGTVEAVAASFLYWLSHTKQRWLIFIDDVPDAEVMEGLWPVGAAGRVVITTTSVEALVGQPDVLILEVGSFSPREAMSYLLSRLSQDSDQRRGAFALIEDLGCQPLALAQATGAIGSSWLTCSDYREQFYQRMRAMAASGGLPPAAGVTWTFSLELARRIVPAEVAQSCLAVAALLDGHGTPTALFETEAARDYIAGTQRLRAQPAAGVQAALTALELGGLLQLDRQADPSLVRMNPALQRVVRLAMSPDLAEQAVQAAAAAVLEAWEFEGGGSPAERWLRSSVMCLHQAAGKLLWSDGCHPVLLKAGRSLDEAMVVGPAVDYWAELLAVGNELCGPAHRDSMTIAERLAAALVAAGRISEAVSSYKRIVADSSGALGADHPRTLTARVMLGRVLVSAGLYEDAVSVLTAALADTERAYGAGHPECAVIRAELVAAYRAAGELGEAIRRYRAVLSEHELDRGLPPADASGTRQLLAEVYLAAGRARDAFSHYRKVVADLQRSLGADHPETLRATAAMAAAYHQAGRMAMAVQLYEQVHRAMGDVLGSDDRETLAVAVNLGRAYDGAGRPDDASLILRDTINRAERVLDPGSPLIRQARESLTAIAR